LTVASTAVANGFLMSPGPSSQPPPPILLAIPQLQLVKLLLFKLYFCVCHDSNYHFGCTMHPTPALLITLHSAKIASDFGSSFPATPTINCVLLL